MRSVLFRPSREAENQTQLSISYGYETARIIDLSGYGGIRIPSARARQRRCGRASGRIGGWQGSGGMRHVALCGACRALISRLTGERTSGRQDSTMANRILTGAVASVALMLGTGGAADTLAEETAYVASQHRIAECPELMGEYQCYSPRQERSYIMRFTTEKKHGQALPVYHYSQDGKKPAKVTPDGKIRIGKKGVKTSFFCRDNSYVMRQVGFINWVHLVFSPLESGDLDIEKQFFAHNELRDSYNIDCKRKP